MLKDSNGNWVDNPTEIEAIIIRFFQGIFQVGPLQCLEPLNIGENIDLVLRELALPQLSRAAVLRLHEPLSEDDIRQAMFDIGDDKYPGLDGFPASFFKTYWQMVGPYVVDAVGRFFQFGHLLKEWNQSLLILIPKQDPPEAVQHLRPISLCNVCINVFLNVSSRVFNHCCPLLLATLIMLLSKGAK